MERIGRLRYLDVPASGSGRGAGVLVLIHGFPLNTSMWEPQLPLAGRGWRVIVPELRGFGDGRNDPPTTSIDDYAGDTIDLLDKLGIKKDAVICGLSMGGYAAFAMFKHAASYFRGMVLADTRSQGDSPEAVVNRKNMQQLVREKGPGAVADALVPKLICEATQKTKPAVAESLRAQITGSSVESIVGALTAMMTRPDVTPMLPSIRIPVQIVVGAEDGVTPPALSEQMHKDIPGSELVVIPGAGHMSNMEQPALFNEAVGRFLDRRV
ncbi:MAG TPA: alpha/beta fold hydrolase [Vicinamibacterales bacterium]|nr:alpha/beta fold hydrolase [Vicinamibacterales bacterium]